MGSNTATHGCTGVPCTICGSVAAPGVTGAAVVGAGVPWTTAVGTTVIGSAWPVPVQDENYQTWTGTTAFPFSQQAAAPQRGWECPRCRVINSPIAMQCNCTPISVGPGEPYAPSVPADPFGPPTIGPSDFTWTDFIVTG